MKRFFIYGTVIILVFVFLVVSGIAEDVKDVELEKIVVTPTRMKESFYQASSNVTIIEKEDIEDSNATHVGDVLKKTLGLNTYSNNTSKTVKVDLRGFADTSISNVLVLIDGRKVNSIDLSGVDWLQIPVEGIEKIEILRGGASVLYGDNAVGGVINIITKKGAKNFSGYIGIKTGSYNTWKEDAELSGSIAEDLTYYLHSRYYETEGYRDNSDVLSKDFNARFDYALTDSLSIDFSSGWHKDDYGMPGGLNAGELEQYGRRGSSSDNNKDFASTKDRFFKLTIDSTPHLFNNIEIGNLVLDLSFRNRDAYSWFYYGGWPSATRYKIDTKGFTARDVYKGTLIGHNFDMVMGLDYYDVEHIIKGSEWNSDDLVIYKEELGFYGYSELEMVDKVFFNGGLRYQEARYRFDQKAPTVNYETRNPSETVFMTGLKYMYGNGSSLHLDIQKTFRFLATDEWYSTWTGLDTNINHQRGMQYEIGIRHNFNDAILLTCTPYWIDIDEEIYVNPAVYPGKNENYDKTRRKGIELGVDIDMLKLTNISLFDSLIYFANITFQESKFKNGPYNGKDIPMVPHCLANTGVNLGLFENWRLSLNGRYTGPSYAINDTNNETPKTKDALVFDSKVSYENSSLECYLGMNNLFNKRYYEYVVKSTGTSTNKDYYPAPERNIEFGVRYKF